MEYLVWQDRLVAQIALATQIKKLRTEPNTRCFDHAECVRDNFWTNTVTADDPYLVTHGTSVGHWVPLSTMSTQLTAAAHQKLQAEFEHLTTTKRVELANTIEAARLLGDLKENGDYHAAKDEQGKVEARIRQLTDMLREVEIISIEDDGIVGLGNIVAIRYDGDDDVETYLLGHLEERSHDVEVLTPNSPLGQVLLGRRVGDIVDFVAPNGTTLKVEVVSVTV